jgi:hypothetical protein
VPVPGSVLDKRKHVRVAGDNRAAVIYVPHDTQPIMCTVTDISEGGIGLTVVNTKAIPETFILEIKGDHRRRSCTVAWRKDPHYLGVSFTRAV